MKKIFLYPFFTPTSDPTPDTESPLPNVPAEYFPPPPDLQSFVLL